MRERPRDKARLEHILMACDIVINAMQKYSFADIVAEPLLYHGLVKQVEIIGEAAYMLSKELKEQHPEVKWKAIEGMRHVLVHDYYCINPSEVRKVAERDIPELRPQIQMMYENEK